MFSLRVVVVVTTPPESVDPPPVFSFHSRVVVVLSAVTPSSFSRVLTIFSLFASAVTCVPGSASAAAITSTFVSVWTLVCCSQLSAILSGVAGGVVFSIVRSCSFSAVASVVRISPTDISDAVLAATSASVRLRSVVAAKVPRNVFRFMVRAASAFFAVCFTFSMSVVQSGFLVSRRSVRTPGVTPAASPVDATDACFTPRCCSISTCSNAVSADL